MRGSERRALRGRWWVTAPCVIVAVLAGLAFASSARAAKSTWTGTSASSAEWSDAANWEGKMAPPLAAGTLEFPPLGGECAEFEPDKPCYLSVNEQAGRSAEELRIDDADGYVLFGKELVLGAGGITAFAPAASREMGATLGLPLKLGAAQKWKLEGKGTMGSNGLEVLGPVSGAPNPLAVELSRQASLFLPGPTEVGPLTVSGTSTTLAGVENGVVYLEEDVNSGDLSPVSLAHIFVTGNAALGPLSTTAAEVNVGYGFRPTGAISVASATFDPASRVELKIAGAGTTVGQDYSQLSSSGAVALNGATLVVRSVPTAKGGECPTLTVGTTYTLISAGGPLSGTFANAPEGGLVAVATDRCAHHPERQLQIAYHRGGAPGTVTGTVVEDAEEAGVRKHREEELQQREAEARRAGERAVAEAYAKRRAEEEAAARAGVLSSQFVSPPAPRISLLGTSLEASPSGVVKLSLSCSGATALPVTAKLLTASAVAASRKAVLTLAAGRYTIACGKAVTVKLRLSAKARRLLAVVRSLRVRGIATGTFNGAPRTVRALMTLRPAKHRRH
jgi:hypothetical protein